MTPYGVVVPARSRLSGTAGMIVRTPPELETLEPR